LLELGAKIKDEQGEVKHVDGFWAKRKQANKVSSEFSKFKNAVIHLEKDHEIFVLELDYMNTNPVVFWIKLFLGIIFIILSICWWFQMYSN
jgi:hypothetical protein